MKRIATAIGLFALLPAAWLWSTEPAAAISAELAKKCRAQALEKYPYYPPGTGTPNVKAQRDYFQKCVDNNGKVEDQQGDNKSSAPQH
ncbi:MAG TPA: hypothetical protein VHA77_14495 [Xanthobacteraceae bacterium]|jgi:hypothetical protein|nr:hypothetical protein [Xanthobacteraceae bacterium]